ncbi:DotU family type IV/VI secretion system protein, partial [Vibrio alfacsensis]
DEETVIWEQDPKKKLSEVSSDKPAVFRTPDAGQMEFLKQFDKSENQLINISAELLAVTLKIDSIPEPDDIAELREQLVARISDLKDKGSHLNYPVAVIDKLCFLFAVVLDEF